FLLGLVLFISVYAGFALQPSTPIIFLLFFLYGIYAAATEGITKAWITNIAHESNTATAIGFYTSCESVCTFSASVIAGILWSNFGSGYTFGTTAIVSLFALFYFLLKIR
ncbi:MAG TPA: MFS transporter, partial [Chitinophagaceae bacterium]|nr:MFS transporter [Chitinophagaceae bacterium]